MLNRVLLGTNLQQVGYAVQMALDGEQALEMLAGQPFDVVLLDLIMPGMDGFQVLEHIKSNASLRHVPVIVISALEEMDSVVRCIEMGATDYLSKPFNPVLLHARISTSLAAKRLHEQEEAHRREMEEYNRYLERRVEEQTHQLRTSFEALQRVLQGTVTALSSLVERRDPYTAGHQQRVSQLACAIAEAMGLPRDQIAGIRVAGVLHDVGKVCVPAEILSKPGRITDAEFGVIAVHPQVGYDILKAIEFSWPVAQIVFQHHEKMNGTGYPSRFAGDDILLEARIIEVADIVEAVAYHRPYRPALGIGKALEEILQKKGVFHDPVVVDACVTLIDEQGFQFD
jgi:putative two-component system response regulator